MKHCVKLHASFDEIAALDRNGELLALVQD